MHEASLYDSPSSFVTLTYDDDHLVSDSLEYSDFKSFLRRLVARVGPTRFFAAGEYGTLTGRPHFHAILFGRSFADRVQIGASLYRSRLLEEVWQHGFSSVGDVSRESASYVASYAVKSVGRRVVRSTGEIVRPPFCRMSLKPGIGEGWFQKYWPEVYLPRDGVPGQDGVVSAAPRYYDKKLAELRPELFEQKQVSRRARLLRDADCFKALRLLSAEVNSMARQKLKKGRGL